MSQETALELAARSLEGRAILRVLYLDPHPGVVRDAPTGSDTVGLAVFCALDDGRIVEICWADDFGLRHGFGIAVRDLRFIDGDRGDIVDVTDRWADHIGVRIASAAIRWRAIEDDIRSSFKIGIAIHADHLTRYDYPRALDLELAGGARIAIDTGFTNRLTILY